MPTYYTDLRDHFSNESDKNLDFYLLQAKSTYPGVFYFDFDVMGHKDAQIQWQIRKNRHGILKNRSGIYKPGEIKKFYVSYPFLGRSVPSLTENEWECINPKTLRVINYIRNVLGPLGYSSHAGEDSYRSKLPEQLIPVYAYQKLTIIDRLGEFADAGAYETSPCDI